MGNQIFHIYNVEAFNQVVNEHTIADYNKTVCGNEKISSKVLNSELAKVSLY